MSSVTAPTANKLTAPKERSSNLELFRIVSMLLIVAHHYVVNSGLTDLMSAQPLTANSIFLSLFGAFGKTGINCFLLITGYFMCTSKISAKKYAKLLGEVYFYKVLFYFVFLLSGYEAFSLKILIKAFWPITQIASNFTGCYLLFFLLIPFLNILISNLSEKQHIKLLLLLAFAYIIIGSMPIIQVSFNYITWYSVLYFIASYIRLYPKNIFNKTALWGWLAVLLLVGSLLSVVICVFANGKFGIGVDRYFFMQDSNKFMAVCLAVSGFLFFKNLNIKNSKFINSVAATMFGVLLIHANSTTMRRWLWEDALKNVKMFDSSYLVLHAIVSVLAVFIICIIVDIVRIRFIEKPFFKFWDKHWPKMIEKYTNFESSVFSRFHI